MTTQIALLRGVNVGGNGKVKMDELRELCEGMGLQRVRTYIQSGNIVFVGPKGAGERLGAEILKAFGVRTFVVIRTLEEMRGIAARNPFPGVDPKKLLVSFLQGTPAAEAVERVNQMGIAPEEVSIHGSDMYIHFPLGQGVSKLPMAKMEKTLGFAGTGRNWNTVLALLAMAEEIS
jgi:uncharacterized protein (DUF1697 family)